MDNYTEELAELEHEQWQHWMKYMIDNIQYSESVERWGRQMKTPYKNLSEQEKKSDRKCADKVMALNSIKIFEYCNMKNQSSYDLFKLFAELTGFKIEEFHKRLGAEFINKASLGGKDDN